MRIIIDENQKWKKYSIGSGFRYPHGIAVKGQYIYVSDQNHNQLKKLDLSYKPTTIAGSGSTMPSELEDALLTTFNFNGGIVFDSQGQLYIADAWHNAIKILSPDEQKVTVFLSSVPQVNNPHAIALHSPRSVTLDNTEKFLIIANCDSGEILKVDVATRTCVGHLDVGKNSGLPVGLAFDKNNTLYFTTSKSVMTVDDEFKSTSEFLSPVVEPKGLLFDFAGQNLWVAEEHYLSKYNTLTKQAMIKIALDWPVSMAFDHTHNLIAAEYNKHTLYRIILRNPLPWKFRRWIWIGFMKNSPSMCLLASLPKEIIQEICSFLWDYYE